MKVAATISIALLLVACPGETPSPRTQIAARRHVLVPVPGDTPHELGDGTVLDSAACASACAPVLVPGESVAACFMARGLPPEATSRFPGIHTFFDCALR